MRRKRNPQSRLRKLVALCDWERVRTALVDRRVLCGLAVLAAVACIRWGLSPSREALAVEGEHLFRHEWERFDELSGGGDGLGPVFNAKSCVACHHLGGAGGAGGNDRNVTAYETFPTPASPQPSGGVVHAEAIDGIARETRQRIEEFFPIIKGGQRVISGCSITVRDFNPVVFHQINTPALFGAGAIDGISGWAIRSAQLSRQAANAAAEIGGDFQRTPVGKARLLPDGRIGKFGWKAQFATLEEFVATACAVEVGLSNHIRKQDIPHEHRPDTEVMPDMTRRQLDSLVAYCALLEAPRCELPDDPAVREAAQTGEMLFAQVGCVDCHTPNLGGVVGVYSDFLLYSLIDANDDPGYSELPPLPLPNHLPHPDEWKTPPLWGVADSAPYMHDGSAPTLEAAIAAHGGAARKVRDRYQKLTPPERAAIVTFLNTLRAPAAPPSEDMVQLASR